MATDGHTESHSGIVEECKVVVRVTTLVEMMIEVALVGVQKGDSATVIEEGSASIPSESASVGSSSGFRIAELVTVSGSSVSGRSVSLG